MCQNLCISINLGDVCYHHVSYCLTTLPGSPEALTEEIQDTARVAPLVVVPGDKLDEMVVKSNACLSIEDGGVGVTVEIS